MAPVFSQSAEIRWFLKGSEHREALLAWFTRQRALPVVREAEPEPPSAVAFVREEPPHSDAYLRLPQCRSASVKRRQGRLEVKALVAGPHPYAHALASGRSDQWVKWSLQPSEALAQGMEAELRRSGPWSRVAKLRYLQKYDFDRGTCTPVSPDARPEAGCNVELTFLEVGAVAEAWTSFGFEAFGGAARVAAVLDEAVHHYLARHGRPAVGLGTRDSLSYPGWLAELASGG